MTTVSKSYALLDKLFRSVFYYEDDGKHEEKHVISEWRRHMNVDDSINYIEILYARCYEELFNALY